MKKVKTYVKGKGKNIGMKESKKLEDHIPRIYKLILKLPIGNYSLPKNLQGFFWAIIVPAFIILEFFITIFLLILFPFPMNIFMAGSIPTLILLVFIKIQLQRILNLWNAEVKQQSFEWDIDRISEEYFSLLKKNKKNEKGKTRESK